MAERRGAALTLAILVVACGDRGSDGGNPMNNAGGAGSAPIAAGSPSAMTSAGREPAMAAGSGGSAAGAGGSAGAITAPAGAGVVAGRGGQGGSSAAGTGAGGGSGGSSSTPGGCTRELLRTTVEAYFEALAARDPSSLALAAGARFTENGEQLELGDEGLWATAGALQHAHSALDTEACSAVAQAVVNDGNTAIPLALRLKLEAQQIAEIETIAVRSGDYLLASNTAALIASDAMVGWERAVPADQRNTREEIADWMEKYFRMFPRGVCDTTSDCTRIENGGGSFRCSAGASCAPGEPGPSDNALTPRLILVDVEAGLGVGFTMFQGNTDMHLFKMYGGQVHGVSAILAEAAGSGWE